MQDYFKSIWTFLRLLISKLNEPHAAHSIWQELVLSYRANQRGYIVGVFSIFVLLVLLIFLSSSRLSGHNLAKIKIGMTTAQVTSILGYPVDTKSQSAVGMTGDTYIYRSGHSEVKVVFLNHKVAAIQSHLE